MNDWEEVEEGDGEDRPEPCPICGDTRPLSPQEGSGWLECPGCGTT